MVRGPAKQTQNNVCNIVSEDNGSRQWMTLAKDNVFYQIFFGADSWQ